MLFVQLFSAQVDITSNQLPSVETAKLTTPETTSYFGNSISFSADGSVLAIGEYGFSTATRVNSGRVQVYTNKSGSWQQKGQDLLGIEDSFNEFGKKVQLSSDGNTLLVYDSQIAIQLNAGETLEDKYGNLAVEFFPYIQVYQFTNNSWVKIGADFLFNEIDEYSDMALSGDGNTLAISKKSSVEVYELNNNSWVQTGQTINSRDATYDDKISLSNNGNILVIGDSYYSDPNSADTLSYEGQVKVYQYTASTWSQIGNTISGNSFLEYFGDKVDISSDGQTIAVASSQVNGNDTVKVYNLTNNIWQQKGTDITQSGSGDILSLALSADANNIIIGEAYNARILRFTTNWQQINTSFVSDNNTDELGYAVTVSADGSSYAVSAPSISTINKNGYVSILAANKNSITRFGDEIYGSGTYDILGSSVAVSGNGNIIAVGARGSYNSSGVWKVGNVKVYEKTNNGLQQIGVDLRNTTDFDSGEFGSEVRLNNEGNILAVSAPFLFSDYGAVYIYKRVGDVWEPLGNVIYGNKDTYAGSGLAMSDDGYTVAIGAPERGGAVSFDDYRGQTTAYKYNIQSNNWEILGDRIIGEGTSDFSGESISLSGDGTILAIGAKGNDGDTTSGAHGHVRVFKFNNNSWLQMGSDIDGDTSFNVNFGNVVKLSNDGKMLVVADLFSQSQAGSVKIYNWNETNSEWEYKTQLKTFTGSGANNSHRYNFGEDISISKDKRILVIGEYNYKSKGKIHIYVKDKFDNWVQNELFLEGTHNTNQLYGGNHSISDNGNTLVVGSAWHNETGTRSGMAAVYHLNLCSSVDGFEVFDGVENTTHPISDNLIKNGSAEIIPITENGWTSVSGNWEWPVRNVQGVDVKFGHKYFRSTISGRAEIYQDIDVTDFSAAINTGNQYFYFSTYLQSFEVNGVEDDSQTVVEYRDDSGNVLDTYDTGLSQVVDKWTLFEDTRLAPIGTKTIRVRLIAINNNEFRAPAAFVDNVILRRSVGPNAVFIPDANFEQYLIDANLDSDGIINQQVLKTDASSVGQLLMANKNIVDLTGIDAFTSLIELNVNNNTLSSLDISKNRSLEKLLAANNQLSSIDLSQNLNLVTLDVGENNLTAIDVSLLTNLESLSCYKNQLTTINLYSNKELLAFIANENQLTNVDIRENTKLFWFDTDDNQLEDLMLKNGNNTKITQFSITGNPNLTCIEVDDVNFSTNNWSAKDNTANYSEDCAPANDDCSKATTLTFNQQTPGDVNSGTANNNPTCAVGNVLADVWYSVVVPDTGEFSIQGATIVGTLKFAVYETCQSLAPIACGTSISLKNLTVGTIFYLKVWIESGSNKSAVNENTGLFTLQASESSVLSVDDFTTENIKLLVYPNPAKTKISITSSSKTEIEKVEIYSILGEKIISNKIEESSIVNIDVSNFATGIYFVKAQTTSKELLSKKLVIE